jgi:hypothetical protein
VPPSFGKQATLSGRLAARNLVMQAAARIFASGDRLALAQTLGRLGQRPFGWTHMMGTPQKQYIIEANGSGVGLLDYDNYRVGYARLTVRCPVCMERRSYIVCTEVFLGQPSWEVMRGDGNGSAVYRGYKQRPDWPKRAVIADRGMFDSRRTHSKVAASWQRRNGIGY